jgi:hypothetical protein
MKESKTITIYPCFGTEELGILQNHLYNYNLTGSFVTKGKARKLCPERTNLLTSGEYVLCPICQSYKNGKLEINLLK